MGKGITKKEFEELQPRCQCPCNELFEWNELYRWKVLPKCKIGHHTRVKHPKGMLGKKHTEETKKKQSEAIKGSRNPFYMKKHKAEFKNKHSNKLKEEGKWKGENNPKFNNWSSYKPYCKRFNKNLKEAVRERDNRLCQLCSKNEAENKEKQTVHHVHYDKENCYPDLICLCRSCNSKVNGNRDYYEKLFMNMLNDKQLLFWTKRISFP